MMILPQAPLKSLQGSLEQLQTGVSFKWPFPACASLELAELHSLLASVLMCFNADLSMTHDDYAKLYFYLICKWDARVCLRFLTEKKTLGKAFGDGRSDLCASALVWGNVHAKFVRGAGVSLFLMSCCHGEGCSEEVGCHGDRLLSEADTQGSVVVPVCHSSPLRSSAPPSRF